ncbi:MAG TPA: FKBP-type peptidyl-prolyl cis-trans isomerase [Thermoanaerobaculia bacterium]|nr:FKBP-type peptidyl-prolyl cis-trans isomerase [Thermoanaerobaculia bacterium]
MNPKILRRTAGGLALGLLLAAAPVLAQAPAAGPVLETDDQKTLYAIGLLIAANLQQFQLTEAEVALVTAGLTDSVVGREPKVKVEEFGPKIQALAQARVAAAAGREQAASEGFLAAEAAKAGAVKSDSGLIYTEMTAGTGASPAATDTVTVHYHGTLRDGKVFDSSVDRGQPATFALNRVIPCWTEGVQKMKVGGKSRLVCPSKIAYGDQGRPPVIPPAATLVFEVELISIAPPTPPPAPAAPPAPPADPKQ